MGYERRRLQDRLKYFALMLFYVKRSLPMEIAVTLLLVGLGYWGIRSNGLALNLTLSSQVIIFGVTGAFWLTIWTFLVQHGYSVFKGEFYARNLTASLAKEYSHASAIQIILGGLTAC